MEQLDKSFLQFPPIAVILLLLIPVVNHICEIVLRLSIFLRKRDAISLVMFILSIFVGTIIGWIDLVMYLLNKKLILA